MNGAHFHGVTQKIVALRIWLEGVSAVHVEFNVYSSE